ncbi:ABC transporter ATP-binding protein [Candidatus Sumerlaeota bacterium]|nr:ABC transporter ATP-binding protein [Candidatus Sumerlaeota bacterium]
MALLEVRGLKVHFHTETGVNQAVDDVSLTVEEGRTLGIVGESGCGKSVTALSIMRLVPDPPGRIIAGQILWNGRDVMKLPVHDLPEFRGREVAMIFQDPMTSLNPVFTIERLLCEVIRKRFRVGKAEARKRALEALNTVGIPDAESRLGNYPHELSGGMKQRILIAMALLCEPKLLIADEPTTALDVTIQKQILYLMKNLQQKNNMALMLITHDIGVIAETCDEVAVMYAGRIVERTDVYTLFSHNRHPYTRSLLTSIPKRGLGKEVPLPTIEGSVPSLFNPPKGCRFAPRCFRRQERCLLEDPQLLPVAENHVTACHFPLEDAV